MDFELEIEGGKKLASALDHIAKVGLQPAPVLDLIGNQLKNRVKLGFRNSKDPYGTAWAPIKHREGKPLLDTGRLRSSITHKTTGDEVVVGTNVEYAAAQNSGATMTVQVKAHTKLITQAFGKPLPFGVYANVKSHKKKMNTTARPFFPTQDKGLPEAWEKSVLKTLVSYLDKVIEGAAA